MPTFREYSKDYFDRYRKPDGSKLSGRSNRCNEIVLRRLNETFGDTPLDRITRQMVDEWYVNARDELTTHTKKPEPVNTGTPVYRDTENRNIEKPKPVKNGIKRNKPARLNVVTATAATLRRHGNKHARIGAQTGYRKR